MPYLITLSTDFSIDPLVSGEIPLAILRVDGVTSVELPAYASIISWRGWAVAKYLQRTVVLESHYAFQ